MSLYTIDQTRWDSLSIFEQMGNIYSEIGRSFTAKSSGRTEDSKAAMVRALDLFDATVEGLIRQRSPRSKEVLRAKEQYLQLIFDEAPPNNDREAFEKYFYQFAVAARLTR